MEQAAVFRLPDEQQKCERHETQPHDRTLREPDDDDQTSHRSRARLPQIPGLPSEEVPGDEASEKEEYPDQYGPDRGVIDELRRSDK